MAMSRGGGCFLSLTSTTVLLHRHESHRAVDIGQVHWVEPATLPWHDKDAHTPSADWRIPCPRLNPLLDISVKAGRRLCHGNPKLTAWLMRLYISSITDQGVNYPRRNGRVLVVQATPFRVHDAARWQLRVRTTRVSIGREISKS